MKRYRKFRDLANFELALSFTLFFADLKPAKPLGYNKSAFSSARKRFVFPRMALLYLGLATHMVAIMRESHLRNYMAEKYFSHLEYIPPAGDTT